MRKNYLVKSFTRLKNLPIDDKTIFQNKADILYYISHPRSSAYEGQIVFSKEEKGLFIICQKENFEFYLEELLFESKIEGFEKIENRIDSESGIKEENISDKKYPTTKAVVEILKEKMNIIKGNENAIPLIDKDGNLKDSGFNIEKLIDEIKSRIKSEENNNESDS